MASTEEFKRLQCFVNVNNEQENYSLIPYKQYDAILNNHAENFDKKVQSLIDVWKNIADLNTYKCNIKYIIEILDWAKLHVLNIVLNGDWRFTQDFLKHKLIENIGSARANLATVSDGFSVCCRKLEDVTRNPWENPTLTRLIQSGDVNIELKEREFFSIESAYFISVRLKKLCEHNCEDFALNLATNFLRYKKISESQNLHLNATDKQLWYIFDIYIALLYKFQDKTKIIQQFEELDLTEGSNLINRFAKKRVKISKIWRHFNKIAIFGSKFFLAKTLIKFSDDLTEFLKNLIKTYLGLYANESQLDDFILSIRNVTNLADASGLHVMCEIIHKEIGDKHRDFATEMYVRALTIDLNELERLKHSNEEDKVKSTSSRLAKKFTSLTDLLDGDVKIARECILTAFSLEPTKERLDKIVELALKCGYPPPDIGTEWKCKLHPPALPSDDIVWTCPECGEWMCKPELTAPLQMNLALNEALQQSALGISEALRDDLVVCLSNPRYQILSWLLPWCNLHRLCMMYLNDPEKTKNLITELKFVDVDYSLYRPIKREPVEEYNGIEKGYERYLKLDFVSDEETSVSGDSMVQDRYLGLGSDGSGDPFLSLPQRRSDPSTLKSLRMFRRMLKRKSTTPDPCPEKRILIRSDSAGPSTSNSLRASSPENEPYDYSIHDRSTNRSPPNPIPPIIPNNDIPMPNIQYPNSNSANYSYESNHPPIYSRPPTMENNVNITTDGGNVAQNYTLPNLNTYNTTSIRLAPNSLTNITVDLPNRENQDRTISLTLNIRSTLEPIPATDTDPTIPPENSDRLTPYECQHYEPTANESNQFGTESKNGVAATLLQLGGQVADSMRQSIQVPNIQQEMKSLPETSLLNGTTINYKTIPNQQQTVPLKLKLSKNRNPKRLKQNTRTLNNKFIKKNHMKNKIYRFNHPEIPIYYLLELMHFNRQTQKRMKVKQLQMANQYRVQRVNNVDLKMKVLSSQTQNFQKSLNTHQMNKISFNQIIPEIYLTELVRQLLGLNCQEKPSLSQRNLCHLMTLVRQQHVHPLVHKLLQSLALQGKCGSRCLGLHLVLRKDEHHSALSQQKMVRVEKYESLCLDIVLDLLKDTHQSDLFPDQMDQSMVSPMENQYPIQRKLFQTQITTILKMFSMLITQYQIIFPILQMHQFHLLPQIQITLEDQQKSQKKTRRPICDGIEAINATASSQISNDLETESKNSSPKQLLTVNSADLCPILDIQKTEFEMNEPDNQMDCSLKNDCTKFEKTDSRILLNNNSNTVLDHTAINNEKYLNAVNNNSVIINRCSGKQEARATQYNKNNLIENTKNVETSMNVINSFKLAIFRDVIKNNLLKPKQKNSYRLVSLVRKLKKMGLQKFLSYFEDCTSNYSKPLRMLQPVNFPSYNTDTGKCENRENKFIYVEDDGEIMNKENQILTKEQNEIYQLVENAMDSNEDEMEIIPFDTHFNKKLKNSAIPMNFNKESNVKKYTNSRKQQHSNVPCFKKDQEQINPKLNINNHIDTQRLKQLPYKIVYDSKKKNYFLEYHLDKTNKEKKIITPLLDSNRTNDCHNADVDFITESCSFLSNKKIKNILKNNVDLNIPPVEKKIHFKTKLLSRKKFKKSVFDYIPGLNDFSQVMPNNTEQIVNVIQVTGSHASTVTSQNIQTSTPVTPHIQRIGQPKISDQATCLIERVPTQSTSNLNSSVIHNVNKPDTSQSSSPLINILNSQPKPNSKASGVSKQTINILSQQIIRQPNHVTMRKLPKAATAGTTTTSTTATCTTATTSTSNFRDQNSTVIRMEPERKSPEDKPLNVNAKVETATQTSNPPTSQNSSPNSTQGGTILQLICRSSLPKFQQAFGKAVYQSNNSNERVAETVGASILESSSQSHTVTTFDTKKIAVPVNFPFTGNVIPIFKGQVPVGQTVGLIPQGGNRQLVRITGSKHEQISLLKETVIQNKGGAFFSATLQGEPKRTQQNGELVEEYSATRITLCKARAGPNATRITKPNQRQFPSNNVTKAPQTNMSSTTLEQIREFDMVYNQVKQRSNNNTNSTESNTVTHIQDAAPLYSLTYVNKFQKYTHFSPLVVVSSYNPLQHSATSVPNVSTQNPTVTCVAQTEAVAVPKVTVKTACKEKNNKGSLTKTDSQSVPAIAKPQPQKPQEDEYTTQRIFDILAEYAEKLRNSPDLNNKPAPRRRSNPPTNPSTPSICSPSKKKKKKTNGSSSNSSVETDTEDLTMGSEDSLGGNTGQLSTTDEEQSQPATFTSENNQESQLPNIIARPIIVSDSSNPPRNVIIANTNIGEALKMPSTALIMPGYIVPVSIVKGNQQIAVVTAGNKIITATPPKPGQNMLLVQSYVNQNKPGNISAVKYSTLQPLAAIPAHSLTAVGAQDSNNTTVISPPYNPISNVTLTQPLAFKKLEDIEKLNNASLLLAIAQPRDVIGLEAALQQQAQPPLQSAPIIAQTPMKIPMNNIDVKLNDVNQVPPVQTTQAPLLNNLQKTNSNTTSVITSVAKKDPIKSSENVLLNVNSFPKVDQQSKQNERTNTILVNVTTSNGPVFSQAHPKFKLQPNSDLFKTDIDKKDEFNGNSDQSSPTDMKINKPNLVYGATRMKRKLDFNQAPNKKPIIQKVQILQKNVPGECKQYGAGISNVRNVFHDVGLTIDPPLEQQKPKIQILDSKVKPAGSNIYINQKIDANGTLITPDNRNEESNITKSSAGEDNTLLPNCHGNVAAVTLTPPLIPGYKDNNSHNLYKYKYKYCNRKKFIQQHETSTEKPTSTWTENYASVSNVQTNNKGGNTKEMNIQSTTLNKTNEIPEKGPYKFPITTNTTTITTTTPSITTQQVIKDVKGNYVPFNGLKSAGTILNQQNKLAAPLPNKKAYIIKKR